MKISLLSLNQISNDYSLIHSYKYNTATELLGIYPKVENLFPHKNLHMDI